MAYISAEEVKEIRNNLKAAFPAKDGYKFSVTRQHGTEVSVSIMEAPIESKDSYVQVNHYYIDNHYEDQPEWKEFLNKVSEIVHEKHWDKSDLQSDYFHCAFYVSINIGKWDRPFICSKEYQEDSDIHEDSYTELFDALIG
jgi:aconitase B